MFIVDDIQKDDAIHLYVWHMAVASDLEIYDIAGQDIILGPVTAKRRTTPRSDGGFKDLGLPIADRGVPMLLVRIIGSTSPELPEDMLNPALETINYIKSDDTHQFTGRSFGIGKRLSIPVRAISPDYKVLLYPFRYGDPLPKTEFVDGHLEVTSGQEISRVRVLPLKDGSSQLRIEGHAN